MRIHELDAHHRVTGSDSLRHAMACINQSGLGLVFVLDQSGALIGTLSDGDIRRALLSGCELDVHIQAHMNASPRVCMDHEVSQTKLLELFEQGSIKTIPVLDNETHQVTGYCRFQDLLLNTSSAAATLHSSNRSEPLDMVAVLMAGGLGSRMLSLTEHTPKPMLEVGGKPIIERTVEHLRDCGVTQFVFTVRYLAHKIEDHFGDGSKWGVSIEYLHEEKRLGTAGALTMLRDRLHKPFLVMNGDLLTRADVANMHAFHHRHAAQLSVAGRHHTINVPYGVLEAQSGRVTRLVEKPDYDFFVNAGMYILDPSTLVHIPEDAFYDITELISTLIDTDARVMCYPLIEEWMDIGRPADLKRAELALERLAQIS